MSMENIVAATTWLQGRDKTLFADLVQDIESHLNHSGATPSPIRQLQVVSAALQAIALFRTHAVSHKAAPLARKQGAPTKDAIAAFIACSEQLHKERERFHALLQSLGGTTDQSDRWNPAASTNLPDDMKSLINEVARATGLLPVSHGPEEIARDCQKEELAV